MVKKTKNQKLIIEEKEAGDVIEQEINPQKEREEREAEMEDNEEEENKD